MTETVRYDWKGYLRKRDARSCCCGLRDERFKMRGDTGDMQARREMNRIVEHIKNHSGIKFTQVDCITFGLLIGIGAAMIFLIGPLLTLLGTIGRILLVFAFLFGVACLIFAGLFRMFSEPYGKESSIKQIEKYMQDNGPGFIEAMNKLGWSMQWNFWETFVSGKRKVSGRYRKYEVFYPTGFVVYLQGTDKYSGDVNEHRRGRPQQYAAQGSPGKALVSENRGMMSFEAQRGPGQPNGGTLNGYQYGYTGQEVPVTGPAVRAGQGY